MLLTRVGRLVLPGVVLLAGATLLSAAELRLRAVEGQGMVVAPGAASSRRLVVAVDDAQGRPVSGATVRFRLPAEGSTGRFASGLTSESVVSGSDGRAAVLGIIWNAQPGPLTVTVYCTLGTEMAELEIPIEISARSSKEANAANPGRFPSTGSNRKWLILAAVIGGGAAIGAGAMLGHSSTSSSSGTITITSVPPTVGTPSITITAPGH